MSILRALVASLAIASEVVFFGGFLALVAQLFVALFSWAQRGEFAAASLSDRFPFLASTLDSFVAKLGVASDFTPISEMWWSFFLLVPFMIVAALFGTVYYTIGGRLGK